MPIANLRLQENIETISCLHTMPSVQKFLSSDMVLCPGFYLYVWRNW